MQLKIPALADQPDGHAQQTADGVGRLVGMLRVAIRRARH
jgi:hypothetical protein